MVADAIDDVRGGGGGGGSGGIPVERGGIRGGTQLDLVDDVVADLEVLLHAQHVVTGARVAVPDEKDSAIAFLHEEFGRFLARQLAKVPGASVVDVERGGAHRVGPGGGGGGQGGI